MGPDRIFVFVSNPARVPLYSLGYLSFKKNSSSFWHIALYQIRLQLNLRYLIVLAEAIPVQ